MRVTDSETPEKSNSDRPVRRALSRAQVLEAAVRLADERGIDHLSMRKLAQILGVEAMSLYNHVASKEDLLTGMVDTVIAEIRLPVTTGDWRAEMADRAEALRGVLARHPWATVLIVSSADIGPSLLAYTEATIACLLAAGFSVPMTDRAWNAIDSYVYGYTLKEQNFPFEPAEYANAARAYLPTLDPATHPALRLMTEHVADGRHDGVHDFGFGLRLILDGLEALRPKGN